MFPNVWEPGKSLQSFETALPTAEIHSLTQESLVDRTGLLPSSHLPHISLSSLLSHSQSPEDNTKGRNSDRKTRLGITWPEHRGFPNQLTLPALEMGAHLPEKCPCGWGLGLWGSLLSSSLQQFLHRPCSPAESQSRCVFLCLCRGAHPEEGSRKMAGLSLQLHDGSSQGWLLSVTLNIVANGLVLIRNTQNS